MGTRSLTFVYDNDDAMINMYRQFDGYPSGHGLELAEFLNSFAEITNGYHFDDTRKIANGMGCLAAQLVSNFKVGVGQFYLYPVTANDCGQEYEYHIHRDRVVVKNYNGNVMFNGDWTAFRSFCLSDDE